MFRDVARRVKAALERTRAETAVRASEERFRGFVNASADVVYRMSPDWSQLRQLDGQGFIHDSPEPSENWMDDYILPEDRGMVQDAIDQAIRTKSQMNLEHRVIRADGTPGWTKSRAIPMLDEHGEILEWLGTDSDITQAKAGQEALRESEERQAFLLQLSDALASLSDPADIQSAAARLVAGQLGVGWCYFNVFDDRGTHATVLGDFRRDGLPSMVGVHDLSGEQDFLDQMRSEAMRDMPDLTSSELFSAQGKAAYGALGMRSALGAPLLRSGRLAAVFLVVDTSVRRWARGEAELLRGVAERTWTALERAQAEAARVKADRSFTRLFEASPAPFLVLAPDPPQFTITEVNDAYLAATMRTREELVGRALFDAFPDNPNDPQSTGVSKLRASLEHVLASQLPDQLPGLKYDIPRPDGTFEERWWSPVNSPILDDKGEVEAIIHNANDVTRERRSERHQALLLAELQHRVRNILTMVRSVARRTADNCEDVDDYVRHLDGRLAALARVQTLLTRDPNRGVDLHEMVLDELHNQAALPAHYQIEGPDLELAPKAADVLSLAVHELATNSTKYGVLAESVGVIQVRWTIDDRDGQPWLRWIWLEPVRRKTDAPARSGFGSELIRNRVPYELRGTGELRLGDNEVEATIDFPLINGASIRGPWPHEGS